MNYKLRRFFETTLPMILLFGLLIVFVTNYLGIGIGIIGVIVYTITDVLMTTKKDFIPRKIQYDGKYFPTLTQLIEYVKNQ